MDGLAGDPVGRAICHPRGVDGGVWVLKRAKTVPAIQRTRLATITARAGCRSPASAVAITQMQKPAASRAIPRVANLWIGLAISPDIRNKLSAQSR